MSNYHYLLETGTTGARQFYYANEQNVLANRGRYYYLDKDLITGNFLSNIALNSQTLLEGELLTFEGANQTVSVLNSGDFYLDFENTANAGRVFLDSGASGVIGETLLYDQLDVPSTGIMREIATLTGSLYEIAEVLEDRGDLNDLLNFQEDVFSGWDVYLNGQKITSTGQLADIPSSISGKIFVLDKQLNYTESTSSSPDLYGTGFIANKCLFYVNGMRQTEDLFIQTYTGVDLLASGQACSVNLINPTINNYNL